MAGTVGPVLLADRVGLGCLGTGRFAHFDVAARVMNPKLAAGAINFPTRLMAELVMPMAEQRTVTYAMLI